MTQLPNKIQVILTISDERWPILTIVGQRTSTSGSPSATIKEEQQYDLAYGKFENTAHNLLRPAVDELIRRRKGQ